MNKKTCTVVIPATLRVSVFKKTIDSFFEHMFDKYIVSGHLLNLILNIDKIGGGSVDDLICCVKGKFNELLVNIEPNASFPAAFKFLWERAYGDYTFYLEDDWELMQDVDLQDLISILEGEEDLAILRLAAFHAGEQKMKNWNKFFPYNGKYYECPEMLKGNVGFCGHPSLIKTKFAQNIAPFLIDTSNPEKQFHKRGNTPIMDEVFRWRYGVYGVFGKPPVVRDLGRKWMVDNNYRKAGCKAHFIKWEKV